MQSEGGGNIRREETEAKKKKKKEWCCWGLFKFGKSPFFSFSSRDVHAAICIAFHSLSRPREKKRGCARGESIVKPAPT